MSMRGNATPVLSGLFGARPDPYAGADLPSAQRVVAVLLGFSSLLALALFPLDPPTDMVGWPGWVAGGGLVVLGLLMALRLGRLDPVWTANGLLAVAYVGLAGLVALGWLSGTAASPYDVVFIAWLGTGVVHPPRRAFTFLAVLVAALFLPLLYADHDSAEVTRLVADALLILASGSVLAIYLDIERKRRVRLRSDGRLAKTDGLTSLGNRRAFEQALDTEIERAGRSGAPLSVALLDLDAFKSINDGYGHLEGDRCLVELAQALERSVRTGDRCFRWAGDEFALLLPDTDHEGAYQLLERVSDHVSATCERPDGEPLRISYGLGELTPEVRAEELVALADVSLLGRKAARRA